MLLAPQVKARSIIDRQAILGRGNVGNIGMQGPGSRTRGYSDSYCK
jgi:hypothetical protein